MTKFFKIKQVENSDYGKWIRDKSQLSKIKKKDELLFKQLFVKVARPNHYKVR